MKTMNFLPVVLLTVAVSSPLAQAQDNTPAAPGPAAIPTTTQSVAEPAVINHVVYLARLPSPAELMKGAEAQATPIIRMDQTADRIVVVYQYAGGRTVTFAYTLLSAVAAAPSPGIAPMATATSATEVVAPAPTTTVVYAEPETVYYSPRYVRYYDPAWDFWAPFTLGVGLGWFGGHNHGGYGWHGGGHSFRYNSGWQGGGHSIRHGGRRH